MGKYKILITNHALEDFRGSETYCFTLCKELSLNHEVYVYTPKRGAVSRKINEFAEILEKPEGKFDIILFNHNNTVLDGFESNCKIYTIHGKYPILEKPPTGMDIYIGISEEISEFYKNLNTITICNGIDTEKFNPSNNNNNLKPKNILYSSNAKGKFSFKLFFASKLFGLNYRRIGLKSNKKDNVLNDLLWADIVVGLGRTALEGLSCNKKVIVADQRFYNLVGMDGLLTRENIYNSMRCNYSGRAFQKPISFKNIFLELKKAISDDSSWERDWILENHDIKKIALKYIYLAEDFLNKNNY